MAPGGAYYAVQKGRKPGIYLSWSECQAQVSQYPNARFKKFQDLKSAELFCASNSSESTGPCSSEAGTPLTTTIVPVIGKRESQGGLARSSVDWARQHYKSSSKLPGFLASIVDAEYPEEPLAGDLHAQDVPINCMLLDGNLVELYHPCSPPQLHARIASLSDFHLSMQASALPRKRKMYAVSEPQLASYRMSDQWEVVYTDGACISNGKRFASAGIGVYWDNRHDPRNISAKLVGQQTNNRAELTAIYAALRQALPDKALVVCTDSLYAINCCMHYIHGWKKNGWKTIDNRAVLNVDLIKAIESLISEKTRIGIAAGLIGPIFQMLHLPSHCGIIGNEMADSLAALAINDSLQ